MDDIKLSRLIANILYDAVTEEELSEDKVSRYKGINLLVREMGNEVEGYRFYWGEDRHDDLLIYRTSYSLIDLYDNNDGKYIKKSKDVAVEDMRSRVNSELEQIDI